MHEPVEDRGAHRVVAQVCAPILHNAVGRDDNAAMQFVALMDQRLQQCASGVGERIKSMVPPIFATTISDVIAGSLKSIRRR